VAPSLVAFRPSVDRKAFLIEPDAEIGYRRAIENLIEDLTNGYVTEVKVALASVVLALAIYQVVLAAVAYGKVRPRFLQSGPASWAHRASGDAILVLTVLVALACIAFYGFDDDAGTHAILGIAVLSVLALKVLAVRIGGSLSRLLPYLGLSLLALLAATWVTSAGDFLGVG
jgi:cytochrome b